MSIREKALKIKGLLASDRLFFGAVIIAVAIASFALGRLSVLGSSSEQPAIGVSIQKSDLGTSSKIETSETVTHTEPVAAEGYVGSKNGTKYHLPWCSGAQRIQEENRVWFTDKAAAAAAGYTPASNCPGI